MITARESYLQEGLEKGLGKGREESQEEAAIEMLRDGMGLNKITKYTKLSMDRVMSLQRSLELG